MRDKRLAIELTKITGYKLVSNEPKTQIYAGLELNLK